MFIVFVNKFRLAYLSKHAAAASQSLFLYTNTARGEGGTWK